MTIEPGALLPSAPVGRRVTVRGVVQGVGFRPFVYALARELGCPATCRTPRTASSSRSRAPTQDVDAFCARIGVQAPPLAGRRVGARTSRSRRGGGTGFAIRPSRPGGADRTLVAPDMATCDDCLAELARPGRPPLPAPVHHLHQLRPAVHHRHRAALRPADDDHGRASRCARRAPASTPTRPTAASTPRPSACPDCGPRLRLQRPPTAESRPPCDEALRLDTVGAARCSPRGAILAVKGIGGYHLACDADDRAGRGDAAQAQGTRRQAVRGDGAPISADVGRAGRTSTTAERALLTGRSRPIVLLRRRRGRRLRSRTSVAPGSADLGVHARLHAAAPPAARAARRPARAPGAGDDQRQPRR